MLRANEITALYLNVFEKFLLKKFLRNHATIFFRVDFMFFIDMKLRNGVSPKPAFLKFYILKG